MHIAGLDGTLSPNLDIRENNVQREWSKADRPDFLVIFKFTCTVKGKSANPPDHSETETETLIDA
jgi:hypothetical protein